MNLPLKIAFRYLFARKSYNVINMISGVGVAGMAIGTAALIIILSVFNGFDSIVSQSLTAANPDLVIKPSAGKVFEPDSTFWSAVWADERIDYASSILEEQVFLSYDDKQTLARVKGIDFAAQDKAPLQKYLIDGRWAFYRGDLPLAVAGSGLAVNLGMNPRFISPIEIHYPSRTSQVSLANPVASLRSVKAMLSGVFSVNAQLDAKLMLVPIGAMRELLEYETEVSSVEIWTSDVAAVKKALEARLGPSFGVLDRYQQEESVYKMMRYEKLAIYLILIFIVLLIAFNIYSSLKMLVIEKQADMWTLRSLGAQEGMLRRIFLLEGWMVSLLGMFIGLVIGIVLVLLQSRYGFVSMPGNFVVTAYPVVLKASDILWTIAGVALIGYLMAIIPSRKL